MAYGRKLGFRCAAGGHWPLQKFEPTEASRAIDEAVAYLCNQLNAIYVDFVNPMAPDSLRGRRPAFERYIIPMSSYAGGRWQPNDDVELIFLTDDSQKRWAEVLVEALNIEVHKWELNEMSKTTEQDLSRAMLNREASGARSRFWHLRHSSPAMCSVKLQYVGIEELGKGGDVLSILRAGVEARPRGVFTKEYDEYLEEFRALQSLMIVLCWGTKTSSDSNSETSSPGLESRLQAVELATESDETVPRAGSSAKADPSSSDEPAPPAMSAEKATPSSSSQRFRDARSALNRLRHDARHADIEYDVGYVDRFEGMKWMSLADWGGKRTEEDDFIPEHRVRMIVRATDTFVVWNRELRIDRTDGEDT